MTFARRKVHALTRSAIGVGLVTLFGCGLTGCGLWPLKPGEESASTRTSQAQPLIPVTVQGVDDALGGNVVAHLSLARKACDTPPAYLQRLAHRAVEEAQDALRAFGHYEARISVSTTRDGDCAAATLEVKPGPRVVLGEVRVILSGPAAEDETFQEVIATHGLLAGDGLHHGTYKTAKQLIERTAAERGYLAGRFTRNVLKVDLARGIADVDLEYASGPRHSLGEVRIAQTPEAVDTALVRRFLDYAPGEPYMASTPALFHTALSGSGYFNTVEVRPLLSAPENGTIPVQIDLTPGKRHKFGAGAGFSTNEGLRGKATYQNRRVNTRGHRLLAEAGTSFIEQRISSEYQIPREHPANEWLSLQGGLRRTDVDTFQTVEAQFGVADTKRRRWGWMERRFVNFNHQSFDVSSGNESTAFIIPGVRWTKAWADNPLFPARGYALDFEVRGAANALLSETSFVRALLHASAVRALPFETRVLARADLGWSWAEDFLQLPPTERFFAGGDTSIRGFDIDALGPRDVNGNVIGGRYLGVGSVEFEKRLAGNWGVALFVDAGNASGGSGSSDGLRVGTGAGLRWYSPIGPIRVDLAHPLDDDTVMRLHVRMGPDL